MRPLGRYDQGRRATTSSRGLPRCMAPTPPGSESMTSFKGRARHRMGALHLELVDPRGARRSPGRLPAESLVVAGRCPVTVAPGRARFDHVGLPVDRYRWEPGTPVGGGRDRWWPSARPPGPALFIYNLAELAPLLVAYMSQFPILRAIRQGTAVRGPHRAQ